MLSAMQVFSNQVKWYTGQGCMICGANVPVAGDVPEIAGVDLGFDDRVDGRFALCFFHAREVGRLVNMVPREVVEAVEESASQTFEASQAFRDEAVAAKEATEQAFDAIDEILKRQFQADNDSVVVSNKGMDV